MKKNYGFDTLSLHAGWRADPDTGAHAMPLYQTSAYLFESAEDAALRFTGENPGDIYTRISNPNVSALESRICALEGGYRTTCFASGMAALLSLVLNLCQPGDEVLGLSTLYGGSYALLYSQLYARYGVKAVCIEPEDLAGLEQAITEKTRLVYFETIANPQASIPDIDAIVEIAHARGVPVAADNTFATPYLFDANAHGIDFTLHSLTKYMTGSGTGLGGSVTDMGTCDFADNPRFLHYSLPDPSQKGRVYAVSGKDAFSDRMRDYFLHDAGFSLSPFNAYLTLLGMQTLSLRMERHVKNADAAARFLHGHPAVEQVNYARLPDSPYFDRAKKYFPKGVAGIFTFLIRGGVPEGRKFIDALTLFSLVANVGDTRSLVVHPASTTHSQMNAEQLRECGIAPNMIRLSIGIESEEDIIADLDAALTASQE